MTHSTPSRLAATTAVVTIAATMAAGTAVADTRAHTSLSIRGAKSIVDAGAHDTISGVLLAAGEALVGVDVALESKPAGASSFGPVAHATTGSHGGVAFVVAPARRTAYELVFAGTSADAPSHSGIVTVDVRPDQRRPTSLSIRLARPSINPGGSDTVSGVLLAGRAALRDRVVVLQRKPVDATTWQRAATKRTGRHGFVAFVVRPGTRTHYRLVFHATRYLRPSHSGVVTVNVRVPATLSIAAAATSIEPGASDTLSGIFSTAGGPVAGRTVALLAKPSDATAWRRVSSATTASDGSVSFAVTPATTTKYALVHLAGYFYTFARSATITVAVRRASSMSVRLAGSTVSGTLFGPGGHPLGGRTVTLVSRPAGTTQDFALVGSATTDDNGHVAFAVAPASSTDYELVFAGGSAYDGCHSGVVTVTVS